MDKVLQGIQAESPIKENRNRTPEKGRGDVQNDAIPKILTPNRVIYKKSPLIEVKN